LPHGSLPALPAEAESQTDSGQQAERAPGHEAQQLARRATR
jgi:hypothetical protein